MKFASPLIEGRLVKRYKRFLADIELEDGQTITSHCANPGAMEGLNMPGLKVWLSKSDNPKRKLSHSWELAELPGPPPAMVGINTSLPNRLAAEAIDNGILAELQGYARMKPEVKYGQNSRIDLLLSNSPQDLCYVEVKNAHLLRQPGLAEFPDTRTERGLKHLRELMQMRADGHRAVMLYIIQRNDADSFAIAEDKDPAYADAFRQARIAGVEMYAYVCSITACDIVVDERIPIADIGAR